MFARATETARKLTGIQGLQDDKGQAQHRVKLYCPGMRLRCLNGNFYPALQRFIPLSWRGDQRFRKGSSSGFNPL